MKGTTPVMYLTCSFALFIWISFLEVHFLNCMPFSQSSLFFIYVLEHTHAPLFKWMDLLQNRPLGNCLYPRSLLFLSSLPHAKMQGMGTRFDLKYHINRQITFISTDLIHSAWGTGAFTALAKATVGHLRWCTFFKWVQHAGFCLLLVKVHS